MNFSFFISIGNSSSANTSQSQQAFIFHVQNQQPLTHKAAVYYHQQLALQEDQGLCYTNESLFNFFLSNFFIEQIFDMINFGHFCVPIQVLI